MNKVKLTNELTNLLNDNFSKKESDFIFTNFIKLFNLIEHKTNYRFYFNKTVPVKLILKRKNFLMKHEIMFDKFFYLDGTPIELEMIPERI